MIFKGKLSSIWTWITKHKIISILLLLALAASVTIGAMILTKDKEEVPVESEQPETVPQKEVSIDFEDGKYGFAGVDKYVDATGDDFTLSVETFNGSNALKCTTYGKNPYVAIQVDLLLGDKISELKSIELDVGTRNPDGTFYATSGNVYAILGTELEKNSVSWSVFKEDGNPKMVTYTLPEGKTFIENNYIVISMESDVGRDKGELPADLYIDNIAFKDAEGNVLSVDTSVTYVEKEIVADRNNLWDLTDIVEFAGFETSGEAWEASGFTIPQEIFDALIPNSVVEIAFESESDEIWLVMPDSESGYTRIGCNYTNNGSGYYNDARTIAQIPFEMLVKYCGSDVSKWGSRMLCESAGKWSVSSVKVGQRVAGTGLDLYVLKDRVYVPGIEEMEVIKEAYGVTGIYLTPEYLNLLKDGGVVEVHYEADENVILWFAGNGAEDADGDGENDWQMIGGPAGNGTENEVRRNFENTVVQITYETLTKYYGEGWADSKDGFWFMMQASGSCKVISIQIGKIGTGEDTWASVQEESNTLLPLYILKDRVYVDGVEDMDLITKEYGVSGLNLSKELLEKLKDGGAIEVSYKLSEAGTSAWFAGSAAWDADGDGENDWQMMGGPAGSAMNADVRRNAAGTVMQITYETLSEYLGKDWANADSYWFMIQASGPCEILSIQIGKVGTGKDTWATVDSNVEEENSTSETLPLYVLKDRVYVDGVENMDLITKEYGVSGLNLSKELLEKLKDGGAIEVSYKLSKSGTSAWFAGSGAEDADGDGENDWQMMGGPAGSAMNADVRRNAAGTVMQITYETLSEYLGKDWANADSYWFMIQASGPCEILSIQIGKVGTGKDTWATVDSNVEEENGTSTTSSLYVLKDRVYVDGVEGMDAITGAYGVSGINLTSELLSKLKEGVAIEVCYTPEVENVILWFAGNDANGEWHMIGHDAEDEVRRSEDGTIIQITYETLTSYYGNGWADANSYWFMLQASGNCTIESIQIGTIGTGEDTWAPVEPEDDNTGDEEIEDDNIGNDDDEESLTLYILKDRVYVSGVENMATITNAYNVSGITLNAELLAKLKDGGAVEVCYTPGTEEIILWFAGNGAEDADGDGENDWQMIGGPVGLGTEDEVRRSEDGTIVQITYETLTKYYGDGWADSENGYYFMMQGSGYCRIESIQIGKIGEGEDTWASDETGDDNSDNNDEENDDTITEDRSNLYTLTDTVEVTSFDTSISAAWSTGGFSVTEEIATKLKEGAVIEIAYECTDAQEWMGAKTLWFAGNDANGTWQMIGYPGDGGVAQDELKWNDSGTIVQITYETLNSYLASGWNATYGWITYQSGGACTIKSITIGTVSVE